MSQPRRAPRYVFDRWCPLGQHLRPLTAFRGIDTPAGLRLARDCRWCEGRRAQVLKARALPMTGVDIDAVHFKRGAVAPGLLARRKADGQG